MPPMRDVDDVALANFAHKRGVDRDVSGLPGCSDKYVPQALEQGDQNQRKIDASAEPAACHESVEKRIVGVFGKVLGELERTDAKWVIQNHQGSQDMASKATAVPGIIVLDQTGALLEKTSYLIE